MIRAESIALVITMFVLSITAAAQDQKPLPSKAKDELKNAILAYQKAKSDADKERLEFQLFSYGRPGVDYLETLRSNKDLADSLAVVLANTTERLGLDILKESVKVQDTYDPSFFVHDEIVLYKRGDIFGGFAVDSKGSNAIEGKLKIRYWSQKADVMKRLSQPGGQFGEVEAVGKKSAKKMRANSAYDEFDFDFTVDGVKFTIHFSGPAAFRVRYDAGTSIALSGNTKPDPFTSTDKSITYRDAYPASLAKVITLLQKYLFRSIPGCEQLMTDETNKDDFAQYEQVQIGVRESRPSRDLIVIVRILEPERVTMQAHHRKFILNFVNEIVPLKDENLVIVGGNSPSMQGNKVWDDKAWIAMPQKALKLLRANMPEDQ